MGTRELAECHAAVASSLVRGLLLYTQIAIIVFVLAGFVIALVKL
ncbi:MAG: hypothetical protein WKF94_02080 [Solirubrobacteraceae bacterium]